LYIIDEPDLKTHVAQKRSMVVVYQKKQ